MANTAALLALMSWGLFALLGAETQSIPAFQLLGMCFAIAAGLMFINQIARRQWRNLRPSLTPSEWLIGTVGLFGFHFAYFMALKYAPPLHVSLISYLWPLLLSVLVASQQHKIKALCAGIVGFAGVSLALFEQPPHTDAMPWQTTHLVGYALALSCAVIWAGYSWFFASRQNKVTDIGWLSLLVAVLAFACHSAFETSHWQLTNYQWLLVFLLGLGPVGGAFYLWDYGMKHGNRSMLASLCFFTPLLSTAVLVLAGKAVWSGQVMVAVGLVLAGALINNVTRMHWRAAKLYTLQQLNKKRA
ncbi:DMT family transporter [Pseudoalteromonas fenneropenaei]|uniref:DMT family transporter n=1 Tax=Pseudoalteromonas fenneropenaei TaxID=1737459 RepID=A0ABV7CG21_9GAMM